MRQVMISLDMIKKHNPCEDGWEKILVARGGENADFGLMFPLSDALDSNGLDDVLWALMCLPELDSLWRKYAVWAARQCQHLMKDGRSIDALNVAWRHSNGDADDDELTGARDAAWAAAARAAAGAAADAAAARAAAGAAADAAAGAAAVAAGAAAVAADAAAGAAGALDAARDAQENKLRQILEAGEWVEWAANYS